MASTNCVLVSTASWCCARHGIWLPVLNTQASWMMTLTTRVAGTVSLASITTLMQRNSSVRTFPVKWHTIPAIGNLKTALALASNSVLIFNPNQYLNFVAKKSPAHRRDFLLYQCLICHVVRWNKIRAFTGFLARFPYSFS